MISVINLKRFHNVTLLIQTQKQHIMTLYKTYFENFDKNYFGAATLSIIGQSCLGGAAAMFVLSNGTSFVQMFQLTLIALVCMIANTSILVIKRFLISCYQPFY